MIQPYYDHAGIQIYHADCRDILPHLPKVDLVLTDPPYGINHNSHGQIFTNAKPINGDESMELALWLLNAVIETPIAMFFSPYRPLSVAWRNVLCWSKGVQVGGGGDIETCWKRDFELIGIKGNGVLWGTRDSAVLQFNGLLKNEHFCEKPIGLMKYLIRKLTTNETDPFEPQKTILDPFMGSGTTLRAAKDLGRRAIGIEIEEKYCEIAARRLSQEVLAL